MTAKLIKVTMVNGDPLFFAHEQFVSVRSLTLAVRRDLLANQFLDTEYGLGYEDECLAISVAYRRKFTSDVQLGLPPSSSWVLRFSLKTGDQPVQPFSLFPQDVFSNTHP